MSIALWELDGEGRTPLMAVADDRSQNWGRKIDTAINPLASLLC